MKNEPPSPPRKLNPIFPVSFFILRLTSKTSSHVRGLISIRASLRTLLL